MKALLDSSTRIAGMLPDHAHHAMSHRWLSQAKLKAFEFVVSGHSLAEVYSVLTRLPRTPRIGPQEACQMLQSNVTACAEIITLEPNDYVALVEDLSQRILGGGLVYDAIIAKAAELAQVDHLVTLNEVHFIKVWPAGGNRIVSALAFTPPSL